METRISATSRAVTILRRGTRATPIRPYCNAQGAPRKPPRARPPRPARAPAARARRGARPGGPADRPSCRPARSSGIARTAAGDGTGGADEPHDTRRERFGRRGASPARATERRRAASSPQATASPCCRRWPDAVSRAWPTVCPRFRAALSPVRSNGSRATARAFTPSERRTASADRGGRTRGQRRLEARHRAVEGRVEQRGLHDLREAGADTRGAEASRASTCRRRRGAARWNAPARFFPEGRSTAVLPPRALSHAARSVVGAWTTGTPRSASAAARPATSPTVPPPSATTPPSRRRPRRTSSSRRRPRTDQVLAASPSGTKRGSLLKTLSVCLQREATRHAV